MSDYDAIIIGAGHNGLVAANVLAKGIASREQFLFCLGTNHRDASVLNLVFGVVKTSLIKCESADGKSIGVFAIDGHGEGASVVLHIRILAATGGDMCDLRYVGGQQIDIV